jgi:glycosyltransferase involved in cell wall biosynthesis
VPADSRARILFVQFTNPAGYPPLEHASRVLAGLGWRVRFLGTGAHGADSLRFPEHPAIREQRMPAFRAGPLQKIAYFGYVAWVLGACAVWRPRWIYASEPMAALPALLGRLALRCRIVYHEHDTPTWTARIGPVQRLLCWARRQLARRADLCVLPQRERLDAFLAETGRTGPTLCVWNCPRRDEVAPPRSEAATTSRRPLRFYYHGSLNETRLPCTVIEALARACSQATLTIVGYETVGSPAYMHRFMTHAARLGIADRVVFRGPMCRAQMLREAANADVGLAFMPIGSCDFNMRHMTGASNKPFDYLAAGVMPLVSDLPDWRAMYVEPGFARSCDPADLQSLADALAWCIAHPDEVRSRAERGRQTIAHAWNYEAQFAPVADLLVGGRARMPTSERASLPGE